MRLMLAVIAVLLPTLAGAQSSRSVDSPSQLPTIGLPLPQIGWPLPTIGASPPAEKPTVRGDQRSPRAPDRRGTPSGPRKGSRSRPSVVVVPVPYYGYGWDVPSPPENVPPAATEPLPTPPEPIAATGTLSLDFEPKRSGELYVDGYYVGTTDDLGSELTLDAGPHSIEFRAAGYESLSVNVRIEPNRALTYRSALTALASTLPADTTKPAADAKPAPAKPIYVIPGCYLGNVPPKDAGLPATCDLSRAITIRP